MGGNGRKGGSRAGGDLSREQEGERVRKPSGPRLLVVPTAVLHDNLEAVVAEAGSVQDIDERQKRSRSATTTALAGPHAHDDALWPHGRGPRALEQHAVANGDRRTFEEYAAEDTGARERRIQRAHGTVRRPAETGVLGTVKRPVLPVDERHQLVDHEREISVGAARGIGVFAGRVVDRQVIDAPRALAAVIDPDNDQGDHPLVFDETRGTLVDVPSAAAGLGVTIAEQILAVVEVEDRVGGSLAELRRQPDAHGALGAKGATLEME